MPHPPVLGLTGGGGWGICLKNSPPGVGQLYNYVLHHYDIASLKLAHAHTVSAFTCCACVFVQAPKFNMDERKSSCPVWRQLSLHCRANYIGNYAIGKETTRGGDTQRVQ